MHVYCVPPWSLDRNSASVDVRFISFESVHGDLDQSIDVRSKFPLHRWTCTVLCVSIHCFGAAMYDMGVFGVGNNKVGCCIKCVLHVACLSPDRLC